MLTESIPEKDLLCWYHTAYQSAQAQGLDPGGLIWLLRELAGVDTLRLRLLQVDSDRPIHLTCALSTLNTLWQQHLTNRVPVQYLTGWVPWRQFRLRVSPDVLIPRPETELLIDFALKATMEAPEFRQGNWVDLGTGSGAILLGLAHVFPQATLHGVDCSAKALAIAQTNLRLHNVSGLESRIHFYQGNWFEPLQVLRHNVQGIISNPPYIPRQKIVTLQPEVQYHEPHLALDGGVDGLEHLRHLINMAPHYLCAGGVWLVEMMAGQAIQVKALLAETGAYDRVEILKDLAGIERFILAYRC